MTKRLLLLTAALLPAPALAHFGLILPPASMVEQEDGRSIDVTFAFLHPFEQYGMELARPESVVVHSGGETTDITASLSPTQVFGEAAYTATIELGRPGAYAIAMSPQPYWEPAEDSYIIHYTKTYVAAFGDDEGWDAELGLPTEIIPLSKPLGLWEGNVFQGIVHRDGQPVPYAEVEIEKWNTDNVPAPSDLMITQTIKADANGVFTYAVPDDGWWGFAALSEADYTLARDGVEKPVELGAVIWVKFEEWDD
ncbi:DUF4198 domain-containing protein [Halovulum dunhuangense]|uniref:DUF4198 domain-containing protein n=1 Tax=Halovulum dunhuangense TaxID=1505036 RepID=A0A849KQ61_9RHOB|nr:DUF4198 domain-containing protein [Halovulum dunhuangense]NNU79203.1 DUF4198 domain-containing protein [Halovulum dunhuangense]